jgi:hypothetical protein
VTVEYLLLGIVLIVMGVVQIWLRHGPGSKDLREERRPGASRSSGGLRGGRVWEAWTAILGGLGVALGIALVVLGALGR